MKSNLINLAIKIIIATQRFTRIHSRQILFAAVFVLGSMLTANAQSYEHSAGVRLGGTSGLTYKKFIVEEQAIEVTLSGRNEGIQLGLNYVQHSQMDFSFNENFYLYYGVGGHLGMERFTNLGKSIAPSFNIDNPTEFTLDDKNYFVMGVGGIIGLEYRWLSIPMTISFDVKPYFNFIGMRYTETKFWDAAISFKYIF